MSSLREAFMANHQRYLAGLGIDLGFVPEVEREGMELLGELPSAFTPRLKAKADEISERAPAPLGGKDALTRSCPQLLALPALSSAYYATGAERYAQAARPYYCEILRACALPGPYDYNYLLYGNFRFLGPLPIFLRSGAFDEPLLEKIVEHACAQLRELSGKVYPARNIRVSAAAALLINSLRLAFRPETRAWLEQGARIMSAEFFRQINPDGSHLEAVPHYHHDTMRHILRPFRLARLFPELKMAVPTERVASLYDYLVAATGPTGWVTGINDGGCEPAVGLYGRGIADILEERAAFRKSLGLSEQPLPQAQCFPQAGQVFLRDGWTNEATWLSFDATLRRSYHWHAARNAIQLRAFGRMLLIDPGAFSYNDPVWAPYAWQTRIHNTLNLNGWDQAETDAVLSHKSAPGYELVTGLYQGGYFADSQLWQSRGAALTAEHHRTLLWIKGRCIVVIDHLWCPSQAGSKPLLEANWQFAAGAVLTVEPERALVHTQFDDANLLLMFALKPAAAVLSVHEGERDPLRGWLSRGLNTKFIPAPQLTLGIDQCEPWSTDLVTVLVPYRGKARPEIEVARCVAPEKTAATYDPGYGLVSLRWGDGTRDDIFWTRALGAALDVREGLTTDASLVHIERDGAGKVVRGLAVDGTYVEPFAPRRRAAPDTFAW